MIIVAYNPDVTEYEKTSLSTSTSAGATSLPVKNSNGFSNTNRILVGAMAREKSELLTVSGSPTPTAIATGASAFPHNVDDPVYNLLFDQIRFYRSTTGIDGTYSLLGTSTIDVDNAEGVTQYNDAAGLASYYYKTSFYNSVTASESDRSDAIAGSGLITNSAGRLIEEVMREVGDKSGTEAERAEYYAWLNEVNYALQKRMRKPYDFLKQTQAFNITAGEGIDYPSDVLHFDNIEYTYTLGGYSRTYNPDPVYYDEWVAYKSNPTLNIPSNETQKLYYDDVEQKIYPYPDFAEDATAVGIIRYWKKFTNIDSDGDVLETVDPNVYKFYLKGMFYRKKSAREERFASVSDRWLSDYNVELNQAVKYNRKNIGEPQSFRMERMPSLRHYRGARYR